MANEKQPIPVVPEPRSGVGSTTEEIVAIIDEGAPDTPDTEAPQED